MITPSKSHSIHASGTSAFRATVSAFIQPCYLANFEQCYSCSNNNNSLIVEISRGAMLCTADLQETMFLYQCMSVAIQRFNAVCLVNVFTVSKSPS